MVAASMAWKRGRGVTMQTLGQPGVISALQKPVQRVYPGQEPAVYGVKLPWSEGGPDPLDLVSVYWNARTSHWHYVSYGLSELTEKVNGNTNVSGWGLELTFRLAAPRDPAGARRGRCGAVSAEALAAPRWPITMLNSLAYNLLASRKRYVDGSFLRTLTPVDPDKRFTAFAFATDPELGHAQTPHGRVTWLQCMCISEEQVEAMRHEPADAPSAVILGIRRQNPLMVTGAKPRETAPGAGPTTRIEYFN